MCLQLEAHLRTVDTYIEGALATEKLKKYPHQGEIILLIENHGFDEYYKNKDDYQGIDIYIENEIKGSKGVIPKSVLEVLKFKGYPVPEGFPGGFMSRMRIARNRINKTNIVNGSSFAGGQVDYRLFQ